LNGLVEITTDTTESEICLVEFGYILSLQMAVNHRKCKLNYTVIMLQATVWLNLKVSAS